MLFFWSECHFKLATLKFMGFHNKTPRKCRETIIYDSRWYVVIRSFRRMIQMAIFSFKFQGYLQFPNFLVLTLRCLLYKYNIILHCVLLERTCDLNNITMFLFVFSYNSLYPPEN